MVHFLNEDCSKDDIFDCLFSIVSQNSQPTRNLDSLPFVALTMIRDDSQSVQKGSDNDFYIVLAEKLKVPYTNLNNKS